MLDFYKKNIGDNRIFLFGVSAFVSLAIAYFVYFKWSANSIDKVDISVSKDIVKTIENPENKPYLTLLTCKKYFPKQRFGDRKRFKFIHKFQSAFENSYQYGDESMFDDVITQPTSIVGHLNLAYQGELNGKSLYAAQLDETVVQVHGKTFADETNIYLISIDDDGSFLDIYLPIDKGEIQEHMVSPVDIAYGLQFSLDASLSSEWSAIEQDYVGLHESNYVLEQEACHVVKSKTHYLEPRRQPHLPIDKKQYSDPFVMASDHLAISDAQEGLMKVSGNDAIEYRFEQQVFSRQKIQIEFNAVDIPPNSPLGIWSVDIVNIGDLADYTKINADEYFATLDQFRLAQHENTLRAMYKDSQPEPMLDLILRDFELGRTEGQMHNKFQMLKEMLWVRPELTSNIVNYMAAKKLAPKPSAKLVYLLEVVGHESAQRALAGMITDDQQQRLTRIQSAISLGRVDTPSLDSASTLKQNYANYDLRRRLASTQDPISSTEADVAYTAILGLGTMSNTFRQGDDRGAAEESAAFIFKSINKSVSANDLHVSLRALDNSRHPDAASIGEKYLDHENYQVRSAAAYLQRFASDPHTLSKLVERLQQEKRHQVGNWIARALEARSDRDKVIEALQDVDLEELDIGVSRRIHKVLASRGQS